MELIAVILLVLLVLFGEVGLYRRRGLEGLSYRCHFSETERTEGESLQFVETVTNDKTLPVPWLKAELTTSRWLDFPEANSAVTGENRFVSSFFSVRSRSRVSRVWEITCEKRGVYEMEHIVLVTSDLLGIVRLSLRAADHGGKLTVLPKRLTEAGLLLPKLLRQQYGEQAVRYSLLTDPCLSAGVREYVTGDPIHRMHWKASAHAGTLLMRQEERTARQTATVLLPRCWTDDTGQRTVGAHHSGVCPVPLGILQQRLAGAAVHRRTQCQGQPHCHALRCRQYHVSPAFAAAGGVAVAGRAVHAPAALAVCQPHDTGNRVADHALYRPACGTLEAAVRRVGAGDGTCT